MLVELRNTLSRLEAIESSTSPTTMLLSRHCDNFAERLQRVAECSSPCVKRILAEELLEAVDVIVYLPDGDNCWKPMEKLALWSRYRRDVEAGRVLDTYYLNYLKARQFVDQWQEYSYESEVFSDNYKAKRYAYALSGLPLPEWYEEDLLLPRLELVVTTYGNMLVTILDYAEESALAVA